MGIEENFGHLSRGTEYCPGFVDKHGQWNNGFYCPIWGEPDIQYCCGTDDHKYCCPWVDPGEEITTTTHHGSNQVPLLIGFAIGCIILVGVVITASCYLCHCCWGYRKRKRITSGLLNPRAIFRRRPRPEAPRTVAFNEDYSHHDSGPLPDLMVVGYPLDDPPPYHPGAMGEACGEDTNMDNTAQKGKDTDQLSIVMPLHAIANPRFDQPLPPAPKCGYNMSAKRRHFMPLEASKDSGTDETFVDSSLSHVSLPEFRVMEPNHVTGQDKHVPQADDNQQVPNFMVLPDMAGRYYSCISLVSSSSGSTESSESSVCLTTRSAHAMGVRSSHSSSNDSVETDDQKRLHFLSGEILTDNATWGCSTL